MTLSTYFKTIKSDRESDIQLLQKDLTSLTHWSVINHLSFNISKFVLLRLHNKFNSEYTVHGNGHHPHPHLPIPPFVRTLEFIYQVIHLEGYIIKLLYYF